MLGFLMLNPTPNTTASMSATVAARTIRLQNIDPNHTQLSFHLAMTTGKIAPRLRRGVSEHPVLIKPGEYFDVCARLGVSFAEAQGLVELSKDVEALTKVVPQRLLVREFPPFPATVERETLAAAQQVAAQAATDLLNPPDPSDAVNVGVDLELAGLPADTPRATRLIVGPPPAPIVDVPEPEPLPMFIPGAAVAARDAAVLAAAESLAGERVPTVATGTPNMDWEREKLETYAREHKIDLKGAQGKVKILKAIQAAASR